MSKATKLAIKTGVATVKTGTNIAVKLCKGTSAICKKQYGDLAERCLPDGTDFSKLSGMPLHIEQKVNLCKEIADGIDISEIKTTLDDIITQYTSPLYKIMFVGRYSSGKSSIINALLGRNILPSGVIPTTKVLTWLLYGEEESVLCEDQDGKLLPSSTDKLMDVSGDNPLNSCRNIFVMSNNPMLKSGVAIIDTPGLSDTNRETVEITESAIDDVDAIIFVIDSYDSQLNKEFLAKLAEKKKTYNLFVLVNKIDTVPEEERTEFIEEKVKILDELKIAANIFPISATDKSLNSMFKKFRATLVEHMLNDMTDARNASIDGRLNAVLKVERKICNDTCELQAKDAKERELVQHKMNADAAKLRTKLQNILSKADAEIDKLEGTVLFNWERKLRTMQSEIDAKIDNSAIEDLKRRDFIEDAVIGETYSFLSGEIETVAANIEQLVKLELDNILSPDINKNFDLGLAKRSGVANIPAAVWPGVFIIGSIILPLGLFATVGTIVAISIGKSMVEGLGAAATGTIETSFMRKQLRQVLSEQWPKFDSDIRNKIREVFKLIREQAHASIEKQAEITLGSNNAILKMLADGENSTKISPEQLKDWQFKIQTLE